jgi:hypothetical protein
MRINVDVKCFKTSEDGRILTAQLTGNSVLVMEPEEQRPTKHHGYVIISKDVSPAIYVQTVFHMRQKAEDCRLDAAYPESWIVAPVDWET